MSICSKDIKGKRNFDVSKGHSSVTNLLKLASNNPNLDLIIVNGYTKFGEILAICSEDIEWKRNSDINQGPPLG